MMHPTDAGSPGFTKRRTVVLQVIRESDGHLTANQVFENARRRMPGISFATVYNSLRYLKNEGLIAEVRFGMEASRYDRKLERHDHALCSGCGRLVDMDLPLPPDMLTTAARLSEFEPESIEIILRGQCADCSEKKDLNKKNQQRTNQHGK